MEEWRFEPAHDFGLSAEQRRLSLRREVGLESAISCFLWRSITRVYLAIAHRLKIRGRENLPDARAVYSGGESCESSRCHHPRRNSAVAICRRRFSDCRGRHIFYETGFVDFRDRIYERVADLAKKLRRAFAGRFAGAIAAKARAFTFCFRKERALARARWRLSSPGLGDWSRGRSIPIVPCYLNGTFAALPASGTVPRWKKISVHVGKPLSFAETTNDRVGWESIAAATENAVGSLMT